MVEHENSGVYVVEVDGKHFAYVKAIGENESFNKRNRKNYWNPSKQMLQQKKLNNLVVNTY